MDDLDRRICLYRSFPQVNYLIASWVEYKQGCHRLQVTLDPTLQGQKIRECWETIKFPFLQSQQQRIDAAGGRDVMEDHEYQMFESFVVNETEILEQTAAAARNINALTIPAVMPSSLYGGTNLSAAAAVATLQSQQLPIPVTPLRFPVSCNQLVSHVTPSPAAGHFSPAPALPTAKSTLSTALLPSPSTVTPAASTAEASWSTGGEDETATLQAAVLAGMQAAELALPDPPPLLMGAAGYSDCLSNLLHLSAAGQQNSVVISASDDTSSLISALPLPPIGGGVVAATAAAKVTRNQIAAKANCLSRSWKYNLASRGKNAKHGATTKSGGFVWAQPFGLFQQGKRRDTFCAAAAEFNAKFTCQFDPYAKLIKLGKDRQKYRCSCLAEQSSCDPIILRFNRLNETGLGVMVKDQLYERTINHFCQGGNVNIPTA